jgi:hypothetical protein
MSIAGLLLKGFGPAGDSGSSPDSPTLAVADDADGTGATATISGATSGTTNKVYVQNRESIGGTWTSAGNRSGNGTLALNLSVGRYFAYCESDLNGVDAISNLVAFSVTSGSESIYETILQEVQSAIQNLSLSGISGVDIQKLPRRSALGSVTLPAVIVSPWSSKRIRTSGPNVRDDIEYPVIVVTVQASNEDQDTNRNRHEQWHETIIARFAHKRLYTNSSADVYQCLVDPSTTFSESGFGAGYDVSAVMLRFVARQSRL